MPMIVGARELKTRLGAHLRAVKAGAIIVVTERGAPIAELRPIPTSADPEQAWLDRLAAVGVLTPGTGAPCAAFKPVALRGRAMAETLDEDREDRL